MKIFIFLLIAIFILNFSLCVSYAQVNNIITNKDIENLKRNSNNGNIPKAKKKNTPIKITPKQEVKQPNITEIKPKEKIETNEPLVNIKNNGTSIQITVKGADPEQDTENDEEEIDYTLPRYLRIIENFLPYDDFESEYSEYFDMHYNDPSVDLKEPKAITVRSLRAPSLGTHLDMCKRGSIYDEGDDGGMYGHLSAHFVIDTNGMIIQTMPLNLKTRGCEGLEYTAFTIDLIGATEQEFNFNERQKDSLYELCLVLCKKFDISPEKIYTQIEVAKGKNFVKEYLDFNDSEYPDSYSPRKNPFGPSIQYIKTIREKINAQIPKKEQK